MGTFTNFTKPAIDIILGSVAEAIVNDKPIGTAFVAEVCIEETESPLCIAEYLRAKGIDAAFTEVLLDAIGCYNRGGKYALHANLDWLTLRVRNLPLVRPIDLFIAAMEDPKLKATIMSVNGLPHFKKATSSLQVA